MNILHRLGFGGPTLIDFFCGHCVGISYVNETRNIKGSDTVSQFMPSSIFSI